MQVGPGDTKLLLKEITSELVLRDIFYIKKSLSLNNVQNFTPLEAMLLNKTGKQGCQKNGWGNERAENKNV
jgi:hypothetical protein